MIEAGRQMAGRLVGRRIAAAPAAPPFTELATPMSAPLGGPGAEAAGVVAPASSLEGLARQTLGVRLGPDPGIRFGDGSFYLPTLAEVQQILVASQLDRRRWMEERFDCDDFAYVLKAEMSVHAYESSALRFGLCVGVVWGDFDWVQGFHAVNWFIDATRTLRFIEPQSDEVYPLERCRGDISLLLV